MMVSITPCCRSGPLDPAGRLLWAVLLWLALALSPARAVEPHIVGASLQQTEDGYALSAEVAFDLSSRLEEVINRGVPLYFVADFELTRPRWYWFDKNVVTRQLTFRLSYNALTRQYRLSTGALYQTFPSLSQALQTMARIREWVVLERGRLEPGESYQVALRFRHDITQLPKPFQVSAIGSRDWSISTDWLRWTLVAPAEAPR